MEEVEAISSQLRSKRLAKEQIDMFTQYIKDFGDESELKEELIYLVKDYNNILSMAEQIQTNCKYESTLVKETKKKGDDIEETGCRPKDDLIKMRLTNAILKQIEFTRKNPLIFTTKYSNGDYRQFLANLINYNYSITTLSSITNDIRKYEASFKASGYSSMSPKPLSKERIEGYSFDKSFRQYRPATIAEQMKYSSQKPFDSYTKEYGDYFDKKLNTHSQIV